jgi:hypothetical protein
LYHEAERVNLTIVRGLHQVHPNTFRGQAAIDWLRGHAARALFGSEAEKVFINPESWILKPQSWILNPETSTLDPGS